MAFHYYLGYILFLIFVLFPTIVYIFPSVFIKIVFMGSFKSATSLNNPDNFKFTFRNFRNFRIRNLKENYELGAWQIICKDDETPGLVPLNESEFARIFSNGRPIFLYFHGNKGSRGAYYRTSFYDLLRNHGFHVLTVDYRGFADSTGVLKTEDDALEDAIITYNYLMTIAPNSSVFIWGHSLGTGISSLLVNKLASLKLTSNVMGLFLEAPFTSFPDLMFHIRYLALWRRMFYFNAVFQQGLIYQKLTFNSTDNLKTFFSPILVLHAEDDNVVSYSMGQKLYSSLLNYKKIVFFKRFPRFNQFGHLFITRSYNITNLIKEFVRKALAQNQTGMPMYINPDMY